MRSARNLRIGLFTVVAGVLTVVALSVFGGYRFWMHRNDYYVDFDRSVLGLEVGADVYVNGVPAGRVGSLQVEPNDIGKVRVTIELDDDMPVRTNTRAILQLAGITGLKEIDLAGGTASAPPLPPGSRIEVGESQLDEIGRRAVQIAEQSNSLIERANEILARAALIVENLSKVSDPARLGEIVDQTRSTARNLAIASEDVRRLIDENRDTVKSGVDTFELAAKRAASLIDSEQLRGALADLRQATRSIKDLAREVRQNPRQLLFGKPLPDRKLP